MDTLEGIGKHLSNKNKELTEQYISKRIRAFKSNTSLTSYEALSLFASSLTDSSELAESAQKFIGLCKNFLQSTLKILLLTGESRCGKTLLCQYFLQQLLASTERNYLPIYVDLEFIDDIKSNFIEKYIQNTYGLDDKQLFLLKKQQNVILIFDHYGNNNQFVNLYSTQRLDEWLAKSIIICDKKQLSSFKDYIPCFVPYHNNKRRLNLFAQSEISLFVLTKANEQRHIFQQIDQPLNKSIHSNKQKNILIKQPSSSYSISVKSRLNELLAHPLNERLITNDTHMISLLADKAKEDKQYVALSFEFIEYSKQDKSLSVAAANAITVLVAANISLAGKNFDNINIPYADLRYAVISHSSFQNANLRYVKFNNAQMFDCDFSHAFLDGAEFGQNPTLTMSGKIHNIYYSYNGLLIAVYDHNSVNLFNTSLWEVERTFSPLKNISGVALSPLGNVLITFQHERFSSKKTGVLSIWDVHSETKLYDHEIQVRLGHEDVDITFLPSLEQQIFAIGFVNEVHLYEIYSQKNPIQLKLIQKFSLPKNAHRLCMISFDPKGEKLAVGVPDCGIFVFNIRTGNIIKTCPDASIPISEILFSPDATYLAIAGSKGTFLWNFGMDKVYALGDYEGWTWDVAFNKSGNLLATGGDSKEVLIWEIESNKCIAKIRVKNLIWQLAFNPTEDILVCSCDGENALLSWNIDEEFRRDNLVYKKLNKTSKSYFKRVILHPNDKKCVITDEYGEVQLWDFNNYKLMRLLKNYDREFMPELKYSCKNAVFDKTGQFLIAGGNENKQKVVHFWDVNSWNEQQIHFKDNLNVSFMFMEVTPNGKWIILISLISYQYIITFYDRETGNHFHLDILSGVPRAIAISPNGTELAVHDSTRHVIYLWSLDKNQFPNKKTNPRYIVVSNEISSMEFSSDGIFLATGIKQSSYNDYSIKLVEDHYSVGENKTIYLFKEYNRWYYVVCKNQYEAIHHGIHQCEISHQATIKVLESVQNIATKGHFREYLLNNSQVEEIRKLILPLIGQPKVIVFDMQTLKLDNHPKFINSSDKDQLIKVQFTAEQFELINHTNDITCISFYSDKFLAVGSADQSVSIWDMKKKSFISSLNIFHSEIVSLCWGRYHHKLLLAVTDKFGIIYSLNVSDDGAKFRLEWASEKLGLIAQNANFDNASISHLNMKLLRQIGATGKVKQLSLFTDNKQLNSYLTHYFNQNKSAPEQQLLFHKLLNSVSGLRRQISDEYTVELINELLSDLQEHYFDNDWDHPVILQKIQLYRMYVQKWFENNLIESISLSNDELLKLAYQYAKNLALTLHRYQVAQFIYKGNLHYFALCSVDLQKQLSLTPELNTLLLKILPLSQRGANYYKFYDDSLINYFMALAMYEEITSYVKNTYQENLNELLTIIINQKLYVEDEQILLFLADYTRYDDEFKQKLLYLIESSKSSEKLQIAAANAISILVKAGFAFINMNFQGIRIPYANLKNAIFDHVNLSNADLSYVQLANSCFKYVEMNNAKLDGVIIEKNFKIEHKKTILSQDYCALTNIFVTGCIGGQVNLWNAQTWQLVKSFETENVKYEDDERQGLRTTKYVRAVAISSDGKLIAAGSESTLYIWNVTTQKYIFKPIVLSEYITSIVFTPDNKFVFLGTADGVIYSWYIKNPDEYFNETGNYLVGIYDNHNAIKQLAISKDGTFLAVVGAIEIQLWHIDEIGKLLPANGKKAKREYKLVPAMDMSTGWYIDDVPPSATLIHNKEVIISLQFTKDNKFIIAIYKDGSLCQWDLYTNSIKNLFPGKKCGYLNYKMALSHDDDLVATVSQDKIIQLWSLSKQKIIQTFSGHTETITGLEFMENSTKLISVSYDKTIRSWGIVLSSQQHLAEQNIHHELFDENNFDINTLYNTECVASLSYGNLALWHATSGQLLGTFPDYHNTEKCGRIAFIKYDNKIGLAVAQNNQLVLWQNNFVTPLNKFDVGYQVTTLASTSDGEYLIVGGWEGITLSLWSVKKQEKIATLIDDSPYTDGIGISCIAISSQNNWLAAGSRDGSVEVWLTKQAIKSLSKEYRSSEYKRLGFFERASLPHIPFVSLRGRYAATALAFSFDEKKLITGAKDGTIWIFSLFEVDRAFFPNNLKERDDTYERHNGAVTSILSLPHVDWVISTGKDNIMRIWNLNTQLCTAKISLPSAISSAAVVSHNQIILACNDATIISMRCDNLETGNDWKLLWRQGGGGNLFWYGTNIRQIQALSAQNHQYLLQNHAISVEPSVKLKELTGNKSIEHILIKYKIQDKSQLAIQKALRMAAHNNQDDDVKRLIQSIDNINAPDSNPQQGKTALHLAVQKGNTNCIVVLVNAGASFTQLDKSSNSAYSYAAAMGRTDITDIFIQKLLSNYELTSNSQPMLEKGLRKAAANQKAEDLKIFIQLVKNINAQDDNPSSKKTALHWAVAKNCLPCTQLLVEAGAGLDIQDAKYRSPINYAEDAHQQRILDIFYPILKNSKSPALQLQSAIHLLTYSFSRNYKNGYAKLNLLSDNDHAMTLIGIIHEIGLIPELDTTNSVKYYQSAAKLNNRLAQLIMLLQQSDKSESVDGLILLSREIKDLLSQVCEKLNYEYVFKWLDELALQKHPEISLLLATLYEFGTISTAVDPVKADKFYYQAALMGRRFARFRLAVSDTVVNLPNKKLRNFDEITDQTEYKHILTAVHNLYNQYLIDIPLPHQRQHSFFYRQYLTNEYFIFRSIAKKIVSHSPYQQELFALIEASKKCKPEMTHIIIAASNAVSTLCRAGVSLENKDLSYAKLPYSHFDNALLKYTNLSFADLTQASMRNTYLFHTNLTHAKMKNIKFGMWPFFQLTNKKFINLVYHPNGKMIAVIAAADPDIYLIDWKLGKLIKTLRGELNDNASDKEIKTSLQFSKDGHYLLVGGDRRFVSLWEIDTGKEFLRDKYNYIAEAHFCPDDKHFAIADRGFLLFEVPTGKPVYDQKDDWGNSWSIQFSLNGQILAIANYYKIKLWDVATGKIKIIFEEKSNNIKDIRINCQNDRIASMSYEGDICLWQIDQIKPILSFKVGDEGWRVIKFSHNGELLAFRNKDNSGSVIEIWDVYRKQLYTKIKIPRLSAIDIEFSSDGTMLAVAHQGGAITLWDIHAGLLLQEYNGHINNVWKIQFHPEYKILSSISQDGTLRHWDLTQKNNDNLCGSKHNIGVFCLQVSPNKKMLVSGDYVGNVILRDLNCGYSSLEFSGHERIVSNIEFSQDGTIFATSDILDVDKSVVKIWNASSGNCIHTFKQGRAGTFDGMHFNNSSTLLFTLSNNELWCWDLHTGKLIQQMKGHIKHIASSCVFRGNNKLYIATAGRDGKICLWDANEFKLMNTFTLAVDLEIYLVEFHPNGKLLAAGCNNGNIFLVNTQNQEVNLMKQNPHKNGIYCLKFSPNGAFIASSDIKGQFQLRDTSSGDILYVKENESIYCVGFNVCNQLVAFGGEERSLYIVDLKTFCVSKTLTGFNAKIMDINFVDSDKIIAASEDASIKMWKFNQTKNEWQLEWDTHPTLGGERVVLDQCVELAQENEILLQQRGIMGSQSNISPQHNASISHDKLEIESTRRLKS